MLFNIEYRGSGFECGISHNDPDALQDHYVIMYENLWVEMESYPVGKNKSCKNIIKMLLLNKSFIQQLPKNSQYFRFQVREARRQRRLARMRKIANTLKK